MSPNLKAFLDTIALSEGTKGIGDDGYNVLVGGSLFDGYEDHPRKSIFLPKLNIHSTAAGRYQVLARYFDVYKNQLGLPDFGHDSQDRIARQMISECHAFPDIESGNIADAIMKCGSRWASFPNNSYGQHQQTFGLLKQAFTDFGGTISEV